MLFRSKELAEQAATGTYTTSQRAIMDSEYQAMAAEIDRIANATEFNGVKLLDGSLQFQHAGSGLKVHFGTGNSAAEDYYYVKIGDMRATEASGLRVGTSDVNEVWRTEALDASTPTAALGGTDGVFGVEFTTDGGTTWQTYGYVEVDAGTDTLTNVMDTINQGRAATGSFTVGSGFGAADVAGQSVTIGSAVFTFTSTGTGTTFSDSTMTGTIDINNITSGGTVINDLVGLINRNVNTVGAYATGGDVSASQTSVINIVSSSFGASASPVVIASTSTSIVASNSNLTGGGGTQLKASLYYDQTNENYELQVEGTEKGEDYEVRFVTSYGTILDGAGARTDNGGLVNAAAGNTYAATYTNMNADADVTEIQNASGTTNWDGKDLLTQSAAQTALAQLDAAIAAKDTARANLGAVQNRLENTITNLQIQAENLQAAESRISDVDVAIEMTEFTKNNILAQAAVAMLAQANSLPQLALQLLGG